jgi:hypothetical protein
MARQWIVDFHLRALELAMEGATEAVPEHRPGIARELVVEALGVANEHCQWAAERGHGPYDTMASVGIELSPLSTWGTALWKLADLWLDEVWPRFSRHRGEARGEPPRWVTK